MGALVDRRLTLRAGDRDYQVEVSGERVLVDGAPIPHDPRAYAITDGDRRLVFLEGEVYEFEVPRQGRRRSSAHHSSLSAPMPATVVRINAQPGSAVKKGDTLLVLEAMKMELPVRASSDGTVTAVSCKEGELVQPGVVLVEMGDG